MSSEKGQSLVEVIVAATVGILVVAALTFTTIFSLRNANFAKNSAQATKLAQEGMERVRTGRDRDQCINNLGAAYSWNGSNSSCGNPVNPIWSFQITGSGGCDDPSSGGKCYFNVDSGGALINRGYAFVPTASNPLPAQVEGIPTVNPMFKRVVLLSDDSSFATQKKVTVVVTWSDFAGSHESKLTTILRKL